MHASDVTLDPCFVLFHVIFWDDKKGPCPLCEGNHWDLHCCQEFQEVEVKFIRYTTLTFYRTVSLVQYCGYGCHFKKSVNIIRADVVSILG